MERYYTVSEVSKLTGIPRRTIYDAIDAGRLRTITPNGCVRGKRTKEAWVVEWLEGKTRRD